MHSRSPSGSAGVLNTGRCKPCTSVMRAPPSSRRSPKGGRRRSRSTNASITGPDPIVGQAYLVEQLDRCQAERRTFSSRPSLVWLCSMTFLTAWQVMPAARAISASSAPLTAAAHDQPVAVVEQLGEVAVASVKFRRRTQVPSPPGGAVRPQPSAWARAVYIDPSLRTTPRRLPPREHSLLCRDFEDAVLADIEPTGPPIRHNASTNRIRGPRFT